MAAAVTYRGHRHGIESAAITVDGERFEANVARTAGDELADACEAVRDHVFDVERDVDPAELAPEPVPGYDELNAGDALALLERLDDENELGLVGEIQTYEQAHKARKTVLEFEVAGQTPDQPPAEPDGAEGSES